MQTIAAKEANSVFKVVDNILRQVFGEKATLLIYRYLEANYSLQKHEFATKIDVFAKGLENFLSSGALVIERRILEDIYSNYGMLHRLEIADAHEKCDFACQVRFAITAQKA